MSREIELWCWVHGDGLNSVFVVRINHSANIHDLKEAILAKKPSFERIVPDTLQLFKFEQPLASFNPDVIKLEDGQPLTSWELISDYWKDEPKKKVLSVILPRPAGTTITPSSSQNSNLSQEPDWLVEIHTKLWGRRDLFNQIFCTAHLTETDFIELQCQLQSHDPERSSKSYVAKDVLTIKSEFLRSKSVTDSNVTAAHFDAGSYGSPVPQLLFDTSRDLTPPISPDVADDATVEDDAVDADVVDADAVDADVVDDDAMDVDPDSDSSSRSYIDTDTAYLSKGTTAVFPCTIRYMDLTVLKLEQPLRTPFLVLLRNEWSEMIDIFNRRRKGLRGSAVFTGQPGIGKTCLLYYILILCIIRAQPIVFQDSMGEVFLINDEVRPRKGKVVVPGDDVLTLVDADDTFCKPDPHLLVANNLRVLLTSSPRTRKDRKWLTQYVKETGAVYVMKPWSRKEFLVASLFLADIDITLRRFHDVTRICGYIPRPCFEAAVSPNSLLRATDALIDAIKETTKLSDAVVDLHAGQPIHRAFEIHPSPMSRYWDSCLSLPVSDWAFSQMISELDRRGANAAYDFYRTIQGTRDSAELCGKIFETKVHKFFQSITEPRTFTMHSLDDWSTTFDIKFSSSTTHYTFGANQRFAGQLASSVNSSQSCYLKPLSPIFPTFDSFLYQHEISQSGCQPLIGIQVTTADEHLINDKGLVAIQKCLKPKIPQLKALRPSTSRKWIILFIVPEPMAASFLKQRFKGAKTSEHWCRKTAQYVLGLPEQEVLRSL